jgi:hypothetical protein
VAALEMLRAMVAQWDAGPIQATGERQLTVDGLRGDALTVDVEPAGDDAVLLRAAWKPQEPLDADLGGLAQIATQRGRGELLCQARGNGIDIRQTLWLQNLSRQSLTVAVYEVVRAYERLERVARVAKTTSTGEVPAAGTEATAPAPTPGRWVATHVAALPGLLARHEPDLSAPVVAKLVGELELQVIERRAEWARVRASNGWTGWVDARLLTAL